MAAIATAICVAALAALLFAEAGRAERLRRIAKTVASLGFLAVPIVGGADLGDRYAALVVAGLALGVGGDIALLGSSERTLAAGIGLFLAGHVAYVIAFVPLAELRGPAIGLGLVGLTIAVTTGRILWSQAGRLRGAVVAYIAVITAMLAAAVALPWPEHLLASAGATLFFFSDLAVARQRFVVESLANKLVGLPLYYAAQLMIGWSAIA